MSSKAHITTLGAASLGIGSMVGAIFALMGEAGSIAGASCYLSFLISGRSPKFRLIPMQN